VGALHLIALEDDERDLLSASSESLHLTGATYLADHDHVFHERFMVTAAW